MRRGCVRVLAGCGGVLAVGLVASAAVWLGGNEAMRLVEGDAPSRAVGSISGGRLENGKRLPTLGWNFTSYSYLGAALGRTSVHHRVRDTLVDAWAELAETHPDVVWVVGETAWPNGGDFWPHKTHQNGLSVDHMVPVRGADGSAARLSCHALNGLCYRVHTDADGRLAGQDIDYAALAALIDALDRHGQSHGLRVRRVIFAPDLQPRLAEDPLGKQVVRRLSFTSKASWVRHDNHIHVDFAVR